MYQQNPFEPSSQSVRSDCNERWEAISQYLICQDKTFLDFGCAEGFFGFKALQAGATHTAFIDIDDFALAWAKEEAVKYGFANRSSFLRELPDSYWDVGIYLDLIYHGSDQPSLKTFADSCKELYISPSGDGESNSSRLLSDLTPLFRFIEPIYTGYMNRTIFRCLR